MKRKSVLITFALLCAGVLQAQSVDEIVANFFKNTGGLEHWKNLNTIKMEGTLAAPGMSGEIPVTILMKRPSMTKIILNFQGPEFVQAFDGEIGWRINPLQGSATPMKLSAEETKELSNKKFENDFVDYQKKGHEITLLGEEVIDGVACYKVQMIKNKNTSQDEEIEITYFDKSTFIPILKSGYAQSGPAKGMEVKTYLSKYLAVDGFLIPGVLEEKVNGQSVRKITLQKISLNEEISDTVFKRPQ